MKRSIRFKLLIIALFGIISCRVDIPLGKTASTTHCLREYVCLKQDKSGSKIEFIAENRSNTEITITVDIRLDNMKASVEFPFTQTIGGNQALKLFTLKSRHLLEFGKYNCFYNWNWGSMYAIHDNSIGYSLPYESGKAYKVTQGFNGKFTHLGENKYAIDWTMPEGTPILAAREGTVIAFVDTNSAGGLDEKFKDKANYILIKHADGSIGSYIHLQQGGVAVRTGQKVSRGELIGYSGNTGYSNGPHLHFMVYTAESGMKRLSHPIKFYTKEDMFIELEEGKEYTSI
jgi:murein DD-endopeptidase MepM/ murein hydrolase activator NlpD